MDKKCFIVSEGNGHPPGGDDNNGDDDDGAILHLGPWKDCPCCPPISLENPIELFNNRLNMASNASFPPKKWDIGLIHNL